MKRPDEYPTLYTAAKYILYDNGMVNRLTTEQAELTCAFARADRAAGQAGLEAAEQELAKLSPEALYEICCDNGGGEQSISDIADTVLNAFFEEQE